MGADFIYAYVLFPGEPNWAAGRAEITRLGTLPAAEWPENFGETVYAEPIIDDPEEEAGITKATAIDALIDDLAMFQEPADDMAVLDLGAYRMYLTAGMSYGDQPTDAFDSFERLQESGVFAAMGAVYEIAPVQPPA